MFDAVFGITKQHAENFQGSVRDAFGSSIITDVLDPILNEITFLRSFNEEFVRQSLKVDLVLQEAQAINFDGSFI